MAIHPNVTGLLIAPPLLVLTLLLKNTAKLVVLTLTTLATGMPADAAVFVVGVTTTMGAAEKASLKEIVTDDELPPLAGEDPVPVSILMTCEPDCPSLAVAFMPLDVVSTVMAGSAADGIDPQ